MDKKFIADKSVKKGSAVKALWLLLIVAIVFVIIIIRFALNGSDSGYRTGLPSNDEAYEMAKSFVKSSTRLDNPSFPDTGYGFGKRSDSVYIISSYVESNGGTERKTNFKVIMKYNGGPKANLNNWTLLDISENQE